MNCNPADPKGNGIIDIWQETVPVRFSSIDKSDRMTLNAIFQIFQEAAISHAENLGVGREEMAKKNLAWVLYRITVLIDRRPNYCEPIIVKSWPRGVEKLFAIRNYEIRGRDGIQAVSARSAWVVLDMEKRHPLRPQILVNEMPQNEGLEALPKEVKGTAALQEMSSLKKIGERKALYSDVDYNGHVNNVRYVQWIEDALDPQILEKANKIRIDINYINEILTGETIELLTSPVDDTKKEQSAGFAFEGRKKENGQAAFRAELRFFY